MGYLDILQNSVNVIGVSHGVARNRLGPCSLEILVAENTTVTKIGELDTHHPIDCSRF